MIYEIKNNDIYVYDKSQFNPEHILECGQVFRYGKDDDGNYYVISKDNKATIIETETAYKIVSNNVHYFVNYFDLNNDYNKIKATLNSHEILKPMLEYGYGIRILNADPEEMIYSFILSQNNNIKRIQKIVAKMCEIGDAKNGYNAFPTSKKLAQMPDEFFAKLGAGYRDKFLKQTAIVLSKIDINSLKLMSSEDLYSYLLTLQGIGPKVASCVLLFGFQKKDKFPVDTWLEQVYYNHFSKEKRTRPEIQNYFESLFKEHSGLAQQYLFYYERTNQNK